MYVIQLFIKIVNWGGAECYFDEYSHTFLFCISVFTFSFRFIFSMNHFFFHPITFPACFEHVCFRSTLKYRQKSRERMTTGKIFVRHSFIIHTFSFV